MEKLKTNELSLGLNQTFRNDLVDNFEKIQNGVDGQSDDLNKQITDLLGDVAPQDQNELTQARIDAHGKLYNTLKGRADATQATAETALSEERDTSVEVQDARTNSSSQTYPTLKERMDNQENDLNNSINDKLSQISSVPETFANLAALKSKYPTGKTGLFVTADNGHKYIWVNGSWTDSGIYQSVGIADNSISNDQLSYNSIQGNIVLTNSYINYDTASGKLAIDGKIGSYVEFGAKKYPFNGLQTVINTGDKLTRFRLVFNVATNSFYTVAWDENISGSEINLGMSYASTGADGNTTYFDNFIFDVLYDGKRPGSAELITRANIATNGMVPNINTSASRIEFPANGTSSSISIDVFGKNYWVDIPASGLNVSYSGLASTGVLLIFNTSDNTLFTDIVDNIDKYSHNFKYGIVAKLRTIGDISVDWGIKYTVNGKLFNNLVTTEQIAPNDLALIQSDNFKYNRSALSHGYNAYENIKLESGGFDVNGVEITSTTNVVTPESNAISGRLSTISVYVFNPTKFYWRLAEYDANKKFIKFLTSFSTSQNLNIALDPTNLYRLEVKTNDASTIDYKEVIGSVKVAAQSNKMTVDFSILNQLIGQGQLVIPGNDRPYFYRLGSYALNITLPNKQLYYYYGNGKTVVLPTSYLNQSFTLNSDNMLIWDLTANTIIQQQSGVTRPFPSVVLANNLYGNITNGLLMKWWEDQTKGIRGYKQNFQDKISKKSVIGVDNFTSQGMVQVGSQLWVGNSSTDDHSTDTIGQIFRLDSGLKKVGRFVHNLGHLNSMDYNSETDSLLTSNTSDNITLISEIIIVQNVNSLNLPESWPLIDYNQNYVVKIPLGVNNIGGGPIFGENKNIVYFMCGQYYGTYKIQKYWLGTGTNDFSSGGYGTFIAGKGENEYNGTAKLLGEFYGPTMEVGQDATYFNGNIYGTFGRNTGKIYKIELNQANSMEAHGTYDLKEAWVLPNYDVNGNNASAEPEGMVIWNGYYLRTSFQNKIVDVPLLNQQFGTGSVGNKVYYDFNSGTEKNITITPTSDVTDIYVSSKDVDGFVVTSKSGGAGTFDWSCNL
ncbi:hypothetical protein [Lactiplantibacillus plantarum]|uniref:hypothetical protein n=1 Tax=Lactiplantibacillus plantarum TaxID=1590 RepID=UPI00240E529D|nr:hypothetical protein [Lactiplantibacillus plantarum]MDG2544724.1 hypothetical protein [Lactiplantibacillus plantarum]